MPFWKLKVGKADPHHQVAALEEPVCLGQARNLFLHDQWPYLTFKLVAARFAHLGHLPVRAALSQSLDLDLAESVADPLGDSWLAGFQKDFGCWLGEHCFRLVAVDGLQLAPPLKAQHDGAPRLPGFR